MGLDLGACPLNYSKCILKTSVGKVSCSNDLKYLLKMHSTSSANTRHVATMFKVDETWLFHGIKIFLNCIFKTVFPKLSLFNEEA